MYVNTDSLRESPALQGFVDFYLTFGGPLAAEVGYVPLAQEEYDQQREQVRQLSAAE